MNWLRPNRGDNEAVMPIELRTKPEFKLAASPLPAPGEFDFEFETLGEKRAYQTYEYDLTTKEQKAFRVATTRQEREQAISALVQRRKTVYKMWQNRKKPTLNTVA